MGYRKLKVNDMTYEFVIGKKFVKIRGPNKFNKIIPLSECGYLIGNPEIYRSDDKKKWMVTPGSLAEYMKVGSVNQNKGLCKKHNKQIYFGYSPFDNEIYDRLTPMWGCSECFAEIAADI